MSFRVSFWVSFRGDPESRFLVALELLLILRGFEGFRGQHFLNRVQHFSKPELELPIQFVQFK